MSEDSPGELGLVPNNTGVVKEDRTPPERLRTSNRVLVYGSRGSGAFDLAEEFERYLNERGIPKPSVGVCRDAKT